MENLRLLSQSQITSLFSRFKKENPNPKSELIAPNPFCFLVSVVLSAQTTDKAVNKATSPLYKIASTPEEMAGLGEEKLSDCIRSIGLYRSKAKHVIALSKILIEKFNSTVPDKREDLEELPGVGRKTANVILNAVYHQETMPVDTHLLRICPKMGLAEGKTPLEIEKSLLDRIPKKFLLHAHHWLILHGRYVCKARNPLCDTCLVSDICMHNEISTR